MASTFWQKLLETYRIENVEGDGNCFYRAIAIAIYDDQEMYDIVREEILTFIISDWRTYLGFFNDGELYAHCRDRTYADGQIVFAASQTYRVNIAVTQPPNIVPIMNPDGGEFPRTIHLLLENVHYQLLVEKNGKTIQKRTRDQRRDQVEKRDQNGNSFYRAIATAYHDDEARYSTVRADVMDHIFNNMNQFAGLFTARELYLHCQEGMQANGQIINATSKAYRVNIAVELPHPIGRIVYPPTEAFPRTITLSLEGEQYRLHDERNDEVAGHGHNDEHRREDDHSDMAKNNDEVQLLPGSSDVSTSKGEEREIPEKVHPSEGESQTMTVYLYDTISDLLEEIQIDAIDFGCFNEEFILNPNVTNNAGKESEPQDKTDEMEAPPDNTNQSKEKDTDNDLRTDEDEDQDTKSEHDYDLKPHKCPSCKRGFSTQKGLRIHMQVHSDKHIYPCNICGQSFRTSIILEAHKRTHYNDDPKPPRNQNGSQESEDSRTTTRLQPKVKPAKVSNGNTKENSQENMETDKNQNSDLQENIDDESINNNDCADENTDNGTDQKPHKCPTCGRGFALKRDMTEHIETHNANNTYICTVCKKGFKTRKGLNRHAKTHIDEKRYQCTICDHRSGTSTNLALHMLTHRKGPKPHKCPYCPKDFWRKACLKRHIETHNPNISYVCSVCQKGFKYRRGFKRHVASHLPNRPIRCPYCIQSFSNKHYLRNHIMRRHEKLRKFKCDICDKVFLNLSSYYDHINMHNGRQYRCPICNSAYTTRAGRRSHMIKVHRLPVKPSPYKDTICICGATGLNTHSWHCHRIIHSANDTANHVMGPKEVTNINMFKTDAMKLKTDQERNFFMDNVKRQDNQKMICCGHVFQEREYFNIHLEYYHSFQQILKTLSTIQQEAIKKPYGSLEEATTALMENVYQPSKEIFNARDWHRKVYVFAFVPVEVLDEHLMHYLSDRNSSYTLYIGGKSGLDGKVSSHHISGQIVVCTNVYASVRPNMRCVHIMDFFIKKQEDMCGLQILNRDEAFLIFKLLMFCKKYEKNLMIQKLETAPLKRNMGRKEFEEIRKDVTNCGGDFFQLQDMKVQFIKEIKIKTSNVTEEMKQSLVCGHCKEQHSSKHELELHKLQAHGNMDVSPWVKMSVNDIFNYETVQDTLNKVGKDANRFLYAAGGFKQKVDGRMEDYLLQKNRVVDVYVGKKSGQGDDPSSYHSIEGIPSTIKKIKVAHLFAYHICNWAFSNDWNLERGERSLIIIGTIRKYMLQGSEQPLIMANSHVVLWDVSYLFSEEEFRNLIVYAYSAQNIFSSPPPMFPSPQFFQNKLL